MALDHSVIFAHQRDASSSIDPSNHRSASLLYR